jgi:hypothetical protein
MLSAALTRALTTPPFLAIEFAPTQWDGAYEKAKFANTLVRFIADDFPRSSFQKGFYRRLSNTFGHIAHYAERAVMRRSSNKLSAMSCDY